ncbi:oxidoreductase [Lysobacter sp. MMG2]|uniref:oxidoreductase n=1 Tax=Lysobacter sp. MMG2 TaxID=2801338 RepID=UPI001C23C4CF|nr:oxidoreductase [Lysobacter sp. MMG2]
MPCSSLFEPIRIGGLELANRLAVGPMHQFSAENGCMSDWHLIHLGHLAFSGAGVLIIETTAVLPEGRTTPADVGLWNDQTQSALCLTIESIRRWCDVPIAVELGHAGRRGSTEVPWLGGGPIAPGTGRDWRTVAPSALPFQSGQTPPRALDRLDLQRIREGFANAAARASRAGVDAIQLHAGDGQLLHQFLSPRSNRRDDAYGGSLHNRMRFPLEVFEAVRNALPARCPVTVRIPAYDGAGNGWSIEQAVVLAQALEARGCDGFQVCTGGLLAQPAPTRAREMAAVRRVKRSIDTPVILAVAEPDFERVEALVTDGHADVVALTRTLVESPRWPWHAARSLHGAVARPIQYRYLAG